MTIEERVLRLENAFSSLAELALRSEERTDILIELVRNHDERMDDLARNHDERMDDFDEKLSALTEAQKRTEENLNILITTVERFISEGRNGKS